MFALKPAAGLPFDDEARGRSQRRGRPESKPSGQDFRMVAKSDGSGDPLSPGALDEIRDLWGSGVPLRVLAQRWNVSVAVLQLQLTEHRRRRQGAADRQAIARELQQRIQARQRGRQPGKE
jgi:hypothetical protein